MRLLFLVMGLFLVVIGTMKAQSDLANETLLIGYFSGALISIAVFDRSIR